VEGRVDDPALHARKLVGPAGPAAVFIRQLLCGERRAEPAPQLVEHEVDAPPGLAGVGLTQPARALFPLEDGCLEWVRH
jgi:hypothetical protein